MAYCTVKRNRMKRRRNCMPYARMHTPIAVACALVLAGAPAIAGPRAHESAARAAGAVRGLRASGLRTRVPDAGLRRTTAGPRQIYVVVDRLTDACRTSLEAAGLAIELPSATAPAVPWPGGELVQGRGSDDVLAAVAELGCVRRLERPGTPLPNVGSVTTAGDALLHADVARGALAADGGGVAVGVISDGADGRAPSIASGDLPVDTTIPAIPGLGDGSGDEGTALLEIVHDLAPGAALRFAGPRTSAEMVLAIDALAAAGTQVIVDDLIFTDEPKFEDGPIAQAARRFVQGGGVYVTAAGNFARAHWFGRYRPTGAAALQGASYVAMHDFGGDDVGDTIVIPSGAEVLIILQWNDPFGAAQSDFDLILARATGGADVVLAASTDEQRDTRNPIEAVRWVNTSNGTVEAYVAIAEFRRRSPAAQVRFNLVLVSGSQIRQQYVVPKESVFGHAALTEAVSVAAADARKPRVPERFSSRGPASIYFPTRETRQVPRVTAVDGVTTAVGRRGAFNEPFFGTSAAAPHVAGCAAVLLAAGVSGARVPEVLFQTAADLGRRGWDRSTGAGLVDCGTAARVASGQARPPTFAGVTASFDDTAAVAVAVAGQDPDADVGSARLVVLDDGGRTLATRDLTIAGATVDFGVTAALRGPDLARARRVQVTVTDASRQSAVTEVAVACTPDGASLGDAFCGVGELLADVAAVPGPGRRRLDALGRHTAQALDRAGRARARGRGARAAVRSAIRGLERIGMASRRVALPGDLGDRIRGRAAVLGERLRLLAT